MAEVIKEQPSYYSIIPANVRYDKDLKPNEKLLYAEITALANDFGFCYTSTKEFALLFNVSTAIISSWINSLEKYNFITKGIENILQIIKTKNHKNLGIGDRECEWCKINTYVLHEHHYPIKKKDGGTEIVKICPNCHHEFHYLENVIKVKNIQDVEIYKKDV